MRKKIVIHNAEQSAPYIWLGCREAERNQTVKGLKNHAPHEVLQKADPEWQHDFFLLAEPFTVWCSRAE